MTATSQQAEFVAKRYFDDLVSRLDDTADYDEAFALFNANPAAAENPLWVKGASIRGEGPLRGLLDAAASKPAVRDMPADGAIKAARTLGDLGSPGTLLNADQQRLIGVLRSAGSPDEALLIAKNADFDLATTRNALTSGSERLVLTNPNHVRAVTNDPQGVNNAIDALRRGSRSDATDPVAEAVALQELEDLQAAAAAAGVDAHGLSRHGAGTTIEQQYLRATTGVRPDVSTDVPGVRRPETASRSTSHVTHKRMLDEARDMITGSGQERVWIRFNDGRVVGEGIDRFAADYFAARWIRVTFNDGRWVTNSFFATDAVRTSTDLVRTIS